MVLQGGPEPENQTDVGWNPNQLLPRYFNVSIDFHFLDLPLFLRVLAPTTKPKRGSS